MSITPYPVQAFRDGKWDEVLSSDLVPGDLVSVREYLFFSQMSLADGSPNKTRLWNPM
jgi:magnesium-transporting ATPase (P-type)